MGEPMPVDKQRAAADAFVAAATERLTDQIQRIILYGSVARGKEHEHSDVDLLILADDAGRQLQCDLSLGACEIGLQYHVDISAQLYSVTHHGKYVAVSFFETVRREGVVIG